MLLKLESLKEKRDFWTGGIEMIVVKVEEAVYIKPVGWGEQ